MRVIDLTLPMRTGMPVFFEQGYEDPRVAAKLWATHESHGFEVHALTLGTHAGTHMDAPAHFFEGARRIGDIEPSAYVGVLLVLRGNGGVWDEATLEGMRDEASLPNARVMLTGTRALDLYGARVLSQWSLPLIVLDCPLARHEGDAYAVNRLLLSADVPMVTDLNSRAAADVETGDHLVVAPLHWPELEASPVRILVIKDEA